MIVSNFHPINFLLYINVPYANYVGKKKKDQKYTNNRYFFFAYTLKPIVSWRTSRSTPDKYTKLSI